MFRARPIPPTSISTDFFPALLLLVVNFLLSGKKGINRDLIYASTLKVQKKMGPYSQHFIFLVTYKWAQ